MDTLHIRCNDSNVRSIIHLPNRYSRTAASLTVCGMAGCTDHGRAGIKTGMKSYPSSDDVLAALGDKVVDALSLSALRAREDLLAYRRSHPTWVAASSERGLANWIHDRQWDHLVSLLTDIAGVSLVDKEPTRDVYVGINYQLRIKRHHWDGKVSTYPTQTALEFMAQPPAQEPLDGMEELHLIAGYYWDKDLRDITAAVLSLRDGVDKQIWLIELPLPPGNLGTGTSAFPVSPTPKAPTIDAGVRADKDEDRAK